MPYFKRNRLDVNFKDNKYEFIIQSLYLKDGKQASFDYMRGYCDKFDANSEVLFGTLKDEVSLYIPFRIICNCIIYFNGNKMSPSYFFENYTSHKNKWDF